MECPSSDRVARNRPRAGVLTDGTSSYPLKLARSRAPPSLPSSPLSAAIGAAVTHSAMDPATAMRSVFICLLSFPIHQRGSVPPGERDRGVRRLRGLPHGEDAIDGSAAE